MTIHPEAPDCACLSCLGYHIFREWLAAATLGAVMNCLAAHQKNARGKF